MLWWISKVENKMNQIIQKFVTKQYINSLKFLFSNFYGSRNLSSNGPVTESLIITKLRENFPAADNINVEDTSGGCGAMFNVVIESPEFEGLSVMKQHKKVYDALRDQIKQIHGIHLETRTPK